MRSTRMLLTAALLGACRAALFEARQRRPRPHRDEKILAAWNGLAISAFARAARVFDDPAWARLAARAAGFLHQRMWQPSTGTLARSFCAGRIGPEGFAEDYAFLAHGLIDLYEATFDLAWLRWAAELQARLDASFRDSDGSYFSSDGRDPSVLVRMKEHHDGAEQPEEEGPQQDPLDGGSPLLALPRSRHFHGALRSHEPVFPPAVRPRSGA